MKEEEEYDKIKGHRDITHQTSTQSILQYV